MVQRVTDGTQKYYPSQSQVVRTYQVSSQNQNPPSLLEIVQGVSAGASLVASLFAIFGNEGQRRTAMQVLSVSTKVLAATLPAPRPVLNPAPAPTLRKALGQGPAPHFDIGPIYAYIAPGRRPLGEMPKKADQPVERIVPLEQALGQLARKQAVIEAELTMLREIVLGDP